MIIKDESLSYKIWCFLVMQFVYFLWMPYPKSLWEKPYPIPDTIANIIFFGVFFFLLIRMLTIHKDNCKSSYLSKKQIVVKIAVLFLAQSVIDLMRTLSSQIPFFYSALYNDVLTVFTWIIYYKILVKKADRAFLFKRRRILAICMIAVFLTFAMISYKNYADASTLAFLNSKYKPSVASIDEFKMNAIFRSQLRNMFLDSIIGIGTIFYSGVKTEDLRFMKKLKFNKWFEKSVAFLMVVFLIFAMKLLILPYSAIGGFDISTFERLSYKENVPRISSYTFSLYRRRSYDFSDKEICYVATRVKMWHKNLRTLRFSIEGDMPPTLGMNGFLQKFDFGEDELRLYGSYAISFVEEGEMHSFLIRRFPQQKKSQTLLEFCRYAVQENNWDIFEYVSPYLLKYDPEFITPYLQRYAAGEFKAAEVLNNRNIRSNYIRNIAENLLKSIK